MLYEEASDNSDDEFIVDDDDIPLETCSEESPEHHQTTQLDDECYPFEILSTEKIMEHMLDSIKEVNSVVDLPSTTARVLLHHFKWDTQKLMECYCDDDREKLFAKAHLPDPQKICLDSSSNATPNCEICCASDSKLTGLKCGHKFCADCWNDYLKTKITEGFVEVITCAGHNCDILVDDSTVLDLLKDPAVKQKYEQQITNSFVECNKLLRWCPTVDCNHVIKVQTVEALPVKCRCNATFCFACGEAWHEPIDCQMLSYWLKQCKEDSESSRWMAINSKDCPRCNTNIEKNGGCNYVVCQKCRQQFCWICKHPTVNYSGHKCIKYESKERSKVVLGRYLFYYDRHMSHRESLKLEAELYAKVDEKMNEMQERHQMSWIDVQFLKKAVDVLRYCRQTLTYTYVFAFYVDDNNQLAIFEDNQQDLEVSVETLSGYLERDIAEDEDSTEIKRKVQDMLCYCESRRKALLAHVREGNERDWWSYAKL